MHGNLSPTETTEPTDHNQIGPDWTVLMLMFGGVLTVAWTGFLLWLASRLGSWALSLT